MKKNSLIGLFVVLFFPVQSYGGPILYSEYVKDNFELFIDLPENYSKYSDQYSVVFYMDANLIMGYEMTKALLQADTTEKLKHTIFIGVAHTGDYQKLRPRDFIPPVLKNGKIKPGKNPFHGHADLFYQFISLELIPYVNKNYPNNGKYTYIGHSYGGLFGFYCLFQPKPIFTNYVMLSPSLWENCHNFFQIEKEFFSKQQELPVNVYHICGGAEWANLILPTSRRMRSILKKRNYQGLGYTYKELKGKGHMGVLRPSLQWVLKEVIF